MKFFLASLLVSCLALTACGGSTTSPSSTPPVIPNYAGNWSGLYSVTNCTQSGGVALANVCGTLSAGSTAVFGFSLSQSGSSINGSFTLGSVPFNGVSGIVSSGGGLTLSGTNTNGSVTAAATWTLTLPPSSTLTGTVAYSVTSSGLTGSANVSGSILSASRGAVFPASAPARVQTMGDLLRAITNR
jgi:hypothetical protein